MLRTLSKHGPSDRSLRLSVRRFSPSTSHGRAAQNHSSKAYLTISCPRRSLLAQQPHSLFRQYSSIVPDFEPPREGKHGPPLASPLSTKPKANLKPGPIKPKLLTVTESRVVSHPRTKAQQKPESKAVPQRSHAKSVTETAKQDLEEAFRNGVLIPPPPDSPWAKRVFHQAKEVFKFYWRGLKMVNTHRKHVNEINRRLKEGGHPLTRWEQKFIRTHHSDRLKLVPFIIIALIAEEIIPLVAIYAPGMLPSTCVLPSQADRIEQQKREKQKASLELFRNDFAQLLSRSGPDGTPLSLLSGNSAPFCQLLRLSTLGPDVLRRRRILKHLDWITMDDTLLKKEGSGIDLSYAELEEALLERGIVTFSTNTKEMQAKLKGWLDSIESHPVDPIAKRLFLVCSNGARSST